MVALWICSLVTLSVLFVSLTKQVTGTRGRLLLDGEPNSAQIYDNHRVIFADKSYYHLAAAGLLNESNISGELLSHTRDGNFDIKNFKFNTTEWFHKVATLHWFIELQERLALHVYDSPNEIDLATGPQVNQRTCGLLLDYMLHMVDKHYQHITNCTEYSIFNIMQSFGSPAPNIASGGLIFPGNYKSCVEHELNVMRKELVKVVDEQREVENFFKEKNNEKKVPTLRQSISLLINKYIGPLFGTIQMSNQKSHNELVEKHKNELRLVSNRYCIAGLRFKQWKRSPFHDRSVALRIATCLPEYCDSKSLNLFHDKIKRLTEIQMPKYYHGYYIENLYCLPDENSKLRDPLNYTDSKLFIAFNIIWFTMTIVVTLLNKNKIINYKSSKFYNGKKTIRSNHFLNLLNCWNFSKNYRIFAEVKSDTKNDDSKTIKNKDNNIQLKKKVSNRVDFKAIEGIKVLGSFSTIISHICMVSLVAAWNPIISNELVSNSLLALIVVVCPIVVNIFFVITGIMTANLLFKASKENLKQLNFWFKFILYRYVRIVPLFALVHWFLQSYFRFLSFGPFWDYGTSNSAWQKVCENDSIWGIIFPIANFKTPAAQCNHVGWYLSNDIQAALITPFFILLFLNGALFGYISTLLIALAMIANHTRYYISQPITSQGGLEISIMTLSQVTDDVAAGYVEPQYRLISYLIGICAGHLLHSYEIGHIKRWPKSFIKLVNTSTWSLICSLLILPYIKEYLPLHNQSWAHLIGAVLSGTVHGVASFVAAGFLLLLCTNNYPTLSRILSGKFFTILANASLSTLLIHIPLIYYHSNTMLSLPELSFHQFITTCFIQIVESLLLAIPFHIIYEIPLRRFFVKLLFIISPTKIESSEITRENNVENNHDSTSNKMK